MKKQKQLCKTEPHEGNKIEQTEDQSETRPRLTIEEQLDAFADVLINHYLNELYAKK